MKIGRGLLYGLLGAGAISILSTLLRGLGLPIQIELLLGTLFGAQAGPLAFVLGLGIHLTIGALFGVLYAWLFETVWNHGGASTGMILAVLHASLFGMFIGLTPQFHPLIPEQMANPGAFYANLGVGGVVAFFALHIIYGALVGAGYGHVAAEKEWAPAGRL